MAKFSLTAAMSKLLAGIASGAITHVAKNAETDALVGEKFIEVNPQMLNDKGEAAVRLTDKGNKAAADAAPGATEAANPAPAAPAFTMVQAIDLPTIKRNVTTKRESKYPLHTIPLGGAIFIPHRTSAKINSLSKQFGSMVSEFNKNNEDRYLTTRTLHDGAEYGFGEEYRGVAGVGIYHRPLSEKPAPKANKE